MEMWEGSTYEAIMQMPSTRRYRMIKKKQELEQERRRQAEAQSRR